MTRQTSLIARIISITALIMTMCTVSWGTGLRIVTSSAVVRLGEEFSFDVVAEGIPASGLGGVQFRLSATPSTGTVTTVSEVGQTGVGDIAVVSPLLVSPAINGRSGLGDFFWNGKGTNGILMMDNETLTNGSALYTFAHTSGSQPLSGSGVVARFAGKIGSGVTASRLDIDLNDVLLMDGGPAYALDYVTGTSVQLQCITKVPALSGLGFTAAQAALTAANLTLGSVYQLSNPTNSLPLNVVLEQSALSGSELECRSAVNVAINVAPVIPAGGAVNLVTTVAPSVMSEDQTGTVQLFVTDLVTAGGEILVEQFVDANRNGSIDQGDYVVRSFKVTDGVMSADPDVPRDSDGTANGGISIHLPSNLKGDIYHTAGQYLFRISQADKSYITSFAVTAVSKSQSISGVVSDGANLVPGAMVRMSDSEGRHIAFAIADEVGRYMLNVADPGSYLVTPFAYGLVSPAPASISLSSGQVLTNQNLVLLSGALHLSGQVKDDSSGVGITGVWIKVMGQNNNAVAISAVDGSYDFLLPSGQYSVSASSDPSEPNPASSGYISTGKPLSISLNTNSTGNDVLLPHGSAIVKGRVVDPSGNGLSGLPVKARLNNDLREPEINRTSDSNGDFTLSLFAGSNWTISLKEGYASLRNLLGNSIRNYDTASGPSTGNDITAHLVTAWVQGIVKDAGNATLVGVEVVLRNADSSITASNITAADGSYRIGTYAGTWYVDALTEKKGYSGIPESTVAVSDGQTTTLNLQIP